VKYLLSVYQDPSFFLIVEFRGLFSCRAMALF
jgi:hypothetical protein